MKWIIILTVIAGICFIYLLIKAIIDGIEAEPIDGTIITYIPTRLHEEDETGHTKVDMSIMDDHLDEVFQENDYIDEFSPENLKIDETLKIINLRKKLKDIDLDYSREDGK